MLEGVRDHPGPWEVQPYWNDCPFANLQPRLCWSWEAVEATIRGIEERESDAYGVPESLDIHVEKVVLDPYFKQEGSNAA